VIVMADLDGEVAVESEPAEGPAATPPPARRPRRANRAPAKLTDGTEEAAAVWVSTDALHAWSNNPRRNDAAVREVMRSIKRWGFGAPIMARPNGEIIAGHTRWEAAKRLKMPKVPVRTMDLPPDEAHLLALADNKLGEIADWDEEKLAAIVADMRERDVDLTDGTGFDDAELDKIRKRLSEDDAPPPAGDDTGKLDGTFQVIVDCKDERDQAMLIDDLTAKGFAVRALMG
jgi:ParB-like chromosome segregation protein Spo0J